MKVVETLWFTNRKGVCGIVLGKEETTDDPKAYIGAVDGGDERCDTEEIIAWGTKLTRDTVLRLLHHFSSKEHP